MPNDKDFLSERVITINKMNIKTKRIKALREDRDEDFSYTFFLERRLVGEASEWICLSDILWFLE
jgi:hypothetical protein